MRMKKRDFLKHYRKNAQHPTKQYIAYESFEKVFRVPLIEPKDTLRCATPPWVGLIELDPSAYRA